MVQQNYPHEVSVDSSACKSVAFEQSDWLDFQLVVFSYG